ncbi:hypothetical protein OQA88_7718 [Cercophora sp. LCS_1]
MASTSGKGHDPETACHSCLHCTRLFLDLRKQEADFVMPATDSFEGEFGRIRGRDTGFTFADAEAAASDGCVLFAFVVRMATLRSADEARSPAWRYRQNQIKAIFTMRARRGEATVGFKVDRAGAGGASGMAEIFAGKFALYTVPGTKPLHEFLGHWLPPNLNPNSQLSFTHARSWIDKCSREHPECIAFNRPFMPARVLQVSPVGASLRVRLLNNPKLAPYATLSYCWGGDQPAKTTLSLLTSYERDIPLSKLPCTIQDALAAVHGIGFQYLWVDAMCIVQDDEDDVVRQISQMHQIYRGSLFTIVSATAETSRDRFLQPRTQHRPTQLEARLDDNVFGSLVAMPVPEMDPVDSSSSLTKYRVFSRGWTFQEGLLSTRILAYGDRELVYQCHQSRHRDGGIEYVTSGPLLVDEGSQIFNHVDPGNRRLGGPPHPLGWGRTVCTYMKRQLTVQDDKLPAISAIAEEYSETKSVTEYYAGLWKEDFLAQCLWRCKWKTRASKPAKYRAPSWSWAAIDGEITYQHKKYDLQPGRPECTDYTFTCSLLGDVRTTLCPGQNRFGKVQGGFMRVRAKMRVMMWNTAPAGGPEEKKWPRGVEDTRPDFAIDCVGEWPENGIVRLWCMEVCTYTDLKKKTAKGEGLLLVEEPGGLGSVEGVVPSLAGSDVFKRVGQVDFHADWYDDGEFPYEWKQVIIV